MRKGSKIKTGFALFLTLSMSVTMTTPTVTVAKSVSAGTNPTKMIDTLLTGKQFVDGEAIAVVAGGTSPDVEADVDLISKLDDDDVSLAMEVEKNEPSQAVKQACDRYSRSYETTYNIVHIKNSSKSTKELLSDLYADSSVLYAAPNYKKNLGPDVLPPNPSPSQTDTPSSVTGPESVGNLTPYQWFVNKQTASKMTTVAANEGLGKNLGIHGWNNPSETNSSGTVAIMDTGFDTNHPDLKNAFYTFSAEQQEKYDCGEHGVNVSCIVPESGITPEEYRRDISDTNSHGTHLAGMLAADWNSFGVSGITNGTKLIGVRVFGDGEEMTDAEVLDGMEWLTKIAKDVNLKAVNLSLGTRESQLTQTLMSNKLGALGVNTVYASGNMGDDLEDNPDMGGQNKSPYSICVGAYNPDGKAAIYSCYGQSSVDVYSTGSYILSTVPSFVPHYNADRRISSRSVYNLFFPETTNPSHLAGGKIEKFTDAPGVLFFDSCPIDKEGNANPDAKELGSVNTQYGVDDKSSLAIRAWDLNVFSADEEYTPPMMYSSNMVGRDLWMAVPIDSADKTNWISFRGTFDDNSHVYTGISGIMLSKSDSGAPVMRDMSVENFLSGNINEYTDNPPVTPGIGATSGTTFSKEAWQKVSLDLDAYVKEVNFFNTIYTDEIGETAMIKNVGNVSGVYEWNKDGKKYMIVEMGLLKGSRPGEDVASKDTNLLIDDVAVGDSHSACGPYSYMSGTSMASPSVVGCLAVIAKNEPANSTLDDTALANEALERGAKLLASVDYDESLSTLCGTGGIVNLHDQTEFTKKAPLFTRADVDGNSLTLSGHFFESNGTIEIDDAQATPEAWDDNSITVDLTGIRGGLHVAKVTNADGAINRVEFSTSRDVDGAVKLYENEYGLMVNDPKFFADRTDCFVGNMVCCKGCLYTVSAGSSRQEAIALWKYDIKNKYWSRCADLPDLIKEMAVRSNSLSVYDGKVYIYEHDTKFGYKEITRPALFSYDPAKDKWAEVKPKGFGSPEKVFSFGGKLFAAYGYNDFRLINVKKKTMTKTKIKLNSLIDFTSAVFAESEGKLYLFTEETNIEGSEYHPYFARMKYNSSKKQFTVTNLSKALKNLYSKDGNVFVVERDHTKLAGIPGGVALIKRPTSGNVHDTYIIKNSSSKVTTLEYTSCYHSVFDPLATYYGGELYAMGISTFENDSMYFRSTHIRTNPLWATGKTATAKKSKKTTLPVKKTIKITGAQGTVSYAKKSGNKRISIAKKTGKITVKKGLKKGTYTVKIKVTAKGNKSYDARTVTATVKIKIK